MQLAATHPVRDWPVPGAEPAIGGLVDCDFRPPGVHDYVANTMALAWNLLEQRSDFLVVIGSDVPTVRDVAQRLVDTAGCSVAAWVPNSSPISLAPPMPVIIQQGYDLVSTEGPVFAVCTNEGSADFIEKLMSAGISAQRLFVTITLQHGPSNNIPGQLIPVGLPRLDAVFLRQQAIATLSTSTRIGILTRLVDRGTSIFITDAPRHVAELLDAIRADPWNSLLTRP